MYRLYVPHGLFKGAELPLDVKQSHYLAHVLRMRIGEEVLIFNGQDGEWRASISQHLKKQVILFVQEQERAQSVDGNIITCFAPLKQARLDYMMQKAVEMGSAQLIPVKTRYTQCQRFNEARAYANAIEAAEQCGRVSLPVISPLIDLKELLATWDPSVPLVFCDEAEKGQSPLKILQGLKETKVGLCIGPEGGFAKEERALLQSYSFVTLISLGKLILRADTAAVAALALIQATRPMV